jgi:hypothetical protein
MLLNQFLDGIRAFSSVSGVAQLRGVVLCTVVVLTSFANRAVETADRFDQG